MTNAAPTPSTPRRTINAVGSLTVIAANEAPPKMTSPDDQVRTRL